MVEAIIQINSRKVYAPSGKCIYCGAERYSDNQKKLAKEHIIPFGLGGQLIYPRASCRACEKITAPFEQFCQQQTLAAFRNSLNLPTRNPSKRPKEAPMQVEVDGILKTIIIPTSIYPVVFAVPIFPKPEIMRDKKANKTNRQSLWTYRLWSSGLAEMLKEKFGVDRYNGASAVVDVSRYAKMLAKIAHSFAVAELGMDAFHPLLPSVIKETNSPLHFYVGGVQPKPEPENCRHKITLATENYHGRSFIVAHLRLFADLGFPAYICIVGLADGDTSWQLPFDDNEAWRFPADEMPENATHLFAQDESNPRTVQDH
jgi:hypothetical protein